MDNDKGKKNSDEQLSKALDEALEENRRENSGSKCSKTCLESCAENELPVEKKICPCARIAENSSRFSLRVMEAMRSLQREDAPLPTISVEDIVNYIDANYRNDGDLYAQVQTSLKQVCADGFVVEMFENEYHLIGPVAVSMNRIACSQNRSDCSLSTRRKKRKRKPRMRDCECDERTLEESDLKRARQRLSRDLTNERSRNVSRRDDRSIEENTGNRNEVTASEETSECTCELGSPGNSMHVESKRDTTRDAFKNGAQEARTKNDNVTRQRAARASLNSSRRNKPRNEAQNGKVDFRVDEETSENADDVYAQVFEGQNRTKARERELKRWIKRCQKECQRRMQ